MDQPGTTTTVHPPSPIDTDQPEEGENPWDD
jgi:hypothetical protein